MLRKITAVLASLFAFTLWGTFAHADPAATYKAKCQMCHGASGKGNAALKVPPFDACKPETDLIKVIADGKGKMPAYKGKLTEAEIKNVIAHIKALK